MKIGRLVRLLGATTLVIVVVFGGMPAAPAASNCSVVTCADAGATGGWTCTGTPMGWGTSYDCTGVATATAGGHSALILPGGAANSLATSCLYTYPGGSFTCGEIGWGPADSTTSNTCTWPGLTGSTSCSSSQSGTWTITGIGLSTGECLGPLLKQYDVDVVTGASGSSAAATDIIGDPASASESATGSLADATMTVCG